MRRLVGVLALSGSLVALSSSCTVNPAASASYTVESLTADVNGDQVKASMVVRASRQVTVQRFGICLRSDAGAQTDVVSAEATITDSGTSYVSDVFSLSKGLYTYYPCFYPDGDQTQVALQGKTLQVGASILAAPEGSPSSGTSATPRGGTPNDDRGPVGLSGSWKSVFADEFSGSRLNLRTWRPNWLAGTDEAITKPVNSRELSCYDPANVTVRGGSARLKIEKRPCTDNQGRTYDYASGLIESAGDYEFRYGFAEVRLFMPPGSDDNCGPNWPAFWLNGRSPGKDGEIDVMECLGPNVSWHYHSDVLDAGGSAPGWEGKMPPTGGWHTFGVDWQPGILTFYYDGVQVGAVTQQVTTSKHYLIVNLAASGVQTTEQTLRVDYVRVWRRN